MYVSSILYLASYLSIEEREKKVNEYLIPSKKK